MNGEDTRVAPVETAVRIGALAAAVLAALFVAGLVPHVLRIRKISTEAEVERLRAPVVATARVVRAPEVSEVLLPGSTQAIEDTGIYARSDGYLKTRYVDLGAQVKTGQLLAEIETPEVDQQHDQAQATLAEAEANVVKLEADLELAKSTLKRYVAAGPDGGVSKQQIDERTSAVKTAEKAVEAGRATVRSQQANLQRLVELRGFQKVVAPFDGIITARSVDPGALISSGSQNGELRSLFRIAKTDTLRVLVYVPQSDAPFVKVDQTVAVTVREFPNDIFGGTVAYTAGALDPSSRTMLAEVHIPNPEHQLMVGMYVTVHFKVARPDPAVLIPGTALLVDSNGVRVAVVDSSNALHYRPVDVGRDFGSQVEVVSGLAPDEVVVNGLSGNILDGSSVQVAKAEKSESGSPAALAKGH